MKILVGYDGSNTAKAALDVARKHAKAFQAEVDVVCSRVKGGQEDEKEIRQAEGWLTYTKQIFEKEGIPCQTHLLIRGLSPGEDVVTFARENHVDEIIIGVRRRSKVGKLMFGSTAQYVILKANCPVVSVK